jgi:hypothetical protein
VKTAHNPDLSIQFDSGEFPQAFKLLMEAISHSTFITRGRVHAQDVSTRPEFDTRELSNVVLTMNVPTLVQPLQSNVRPNLPWAEDHFQERVGGKPLNPSPSESWWPYKQNGNAAHKDGETFSHTYPERMWPKMAGVGSNHYSDRHPLWGVRYKYGDLNDLVSLLVRDPFTRQAFLPIWFPEDTGSVEGQRVPCSLGYHFIRRGVYLDCQYYMRSCDLFRHFTDDTYMAARLMQWVCQSLWEQDKWGDMLDEGLYPFVGKLTMYISNLHCFRGDEYKFKEVK